jgi:hypothetical protein
MQGFGDGAIARAESAAAAAVREDDQADGAVRHVRVGRNLLTSLNGQRDGLSDDA